MAENEVPQAVVETEKTGLVNEVPQAVVETEKTGLVKIKESAPVAPLMTRDELTTKRDELTTKMEELFARAQAAGMSPIQAMLATYAKRGMTLIDAFLSALEESGSTEKPSATETKKSDASK